MKNLPQVDHWIEPIVDNEQEETFVAFAQRRWDVTPRYTVFVLVSYLKGRGVRHWEQKRLAFERLDKMLEKQERRLHSYYGTHFHEQFAWHAQNGDLPEWIRKQDGPLHAAQ